MAAIRVIDEHSELTAAGEVTHQQIDAAFLSGSLLVVDATNAPNSARVLVAGTGITIQDNGPGSTFVISASAVTASQVNFSWNEVPSGSIDGVNRVFSFLNAPTQPETFMLFLNGMKQREGALSDFVLSGSTVTFAVDNVPRSGANVDATYQY